jgi:hypothetical protein
VRHKIRCNVHSAEGWEEVLLPEIDRQQKLGKEVVFRADAAFAKPGEALRCLKRSAPEGSFRAPGALEGGKGTPYTARESMPCRTTQVGFDAGRGTGVDWP